MTTFRTDITVRDIMDVADMVAAGWSMEVNEPIDAIGTARPILVTLLPNDDRPGGYAGEGATVAGALAEAIDNVMLCGAWPSDEVEIGNPFPDTMGVDDGRMTLHQRDFDPLTD